jgi:glycosyltransferase involved in cell wall biosynthesis
MFCSAIIPTINRPTLSRTVYSVLNQKFSSDEFEVIVVNDSGQPLPEMEWQLFPCVQVITTQKRERSVARNTGAAIARGQFLYFLDDDDIMLPGAMQEFWDLAQRTDAKWLYGCYRSVDNDGNPVAEFHPKIAGNISAWLVAGESIPLQSSMFQFKAFYEAGEFDVYFTGAQDRDLERRFSLRFQAANTQTLVAQIRVGEVKSSTNWTKLPEFDRWGREKAFDQLNAFHALWESTNRDGFLHGRVARAYLASAAWNLSHKYFLKATSRFFFFSIFSIPFLLSPNFWHGIFTHVPPLGYLGPR